MAGEKGNGKRARLDEGDVGFVEYRSYPFQSKQQLKAMSIYERIPVSLWRLMKLPCFLYKLGFHHFMGNIVLVLTTIGRRSGLKRVTPLQYEKIDDTYFVASARGVKADWYRNIVSNPKVEVQVGSHHFYALAEPTTDPSRIADFLEVRLMRHPIMMGMMLRSEGLPQNPTREQLAGFAQRSAMVVIRPVEEKA
jgi:deazaflavin-dependent oxidoreductase (nitroreductase family)